MSIDEIIGGDDYTGGSLTGRLWRGEFAATAANVSARLPVLIPGIDGARQHGPARWAPVVDAAGLAVLPARGDDCLVGFDDEHEPWVIGWWPHG